MQLSNITALCFGLLVASGLCACDQDDPSIELLDEVATFRGVNNPLYSPAGMAFCADILNEFVAVQQTPDADDGPAADESVTQQRNNPLYQGAGTEACAEILNEFVAMQQSTDASICVIVDPDDDTIELVPCDDDPSGNGGITISL